MSVLLAFGIRLLEFMFFAGWAGSLVVLVITGVEDFETLFRAIKRENH